ncbi:hypothetical protein IAQ67_29105 (plasmid) [Paenibacillus peoriae]|uniref:Uncharacterized protein n=1 Tax=Paenibacillus peoriae TaxID=59893 RepID=A0A7H0YH55_9BACL|nr:hypothetical protein [Paenibacillus peoriae]QNR70413.1 hypothetical protein IAQ67_29105 [Paenibacillus peoriae]
MSSIRAFDRAQDAFNLAKKEPVQQKVLMFIIPSKVKQGVVKTETRFPYAGRIVSAYASCGTAGTTVTEIQVERCSQSDYDTIPNWNNIFADNLKFAADAKSTTNSTYAMADDAVHPDDHFRVNVVGLGQGIEDIVLEVVIQI